MCLKCKSESVHIKTAHHLISFLLATGLVTCIRLLTRDDLAQHDHTISIHECNTGEAFAILKCVAHERLLGCEGAFCHLVGLQGVRILHLLASGLFAHLPCELDNAAGRATASHKANGRVANLDLVGDVQDLNLSSKLPCLSQGGVLLVDHNVTSVRHVFLDQALNIQAYIVTWVCKFCACV